jgi:hypothetical protein
LTSASSAAAGIRRAPSRTISSIREPFEVAPSALTTLSTEARFPTDVRSVGLLGDLQSITREGTAFARSPSPDPQVLNIALRERGWGRVISVGSRAATPLPNMVEYSAAKAAVVNAVGDDRMRRMFEDGASSRGRPQERSQLEPHMVAEYAPNPTGRLGTTEDCGGRSRRSGLHVER